MLVLGIDPGTRATGYGAIERSGARFRCGEHGVIRPSRTLSLAERLLAIHDALAEIVARVGPHVVAVEDCFSSRDPRATVKLGHVKGIVLVVAARSGLEAIEYAPRRVKQAVVGNGNATKEQVRFMIRRMVIRPPGADGALTDELPLDLTDALAVAICHHHAARVPT